MPKERNPTVLGRLLSRGVHLLKSPAQTRIKVFDASCAIGIRILPVSCFAPLITYDRLGRRSHKALATALKQCLIQGRVRDGERILAVMKQSTAGIVAGRRLIRGYAASLTPPKLLEPESFAKHLQSVDGLPEIADAQRTTINWLLRPASVLPISVSMVVSRPLRVLVVSKANWNFMLAPSAYLKNAGMEVRYFPFEELERSFQSARKENKSLPSVEDMLFAGPMNPSQEDVMAMVRKLAPWAAGLLDWCDIVFAEWWHSPAAWLSRYLRQDKTLAIRCHSYEVFTKFPTFTNIERVDGLIFVGAHIQKIYEKLYAGGPLARNMRVIQNVRNLSQISSFAKEADARHTLGMLGYATPNKDPLFALEVLEHLNRNGGDWTLRLAGTPWQERSKDPKHNEYRDRFEAMSKQSGRVRLTPFTRDIGSWLRHVGFILSTSHREGSHEAVVEGMSTGAIPVIRRWPMVAEFGAPESVFPGINCFSTAESAAEYIVEASQHFEHESARFKRLALDRYDGDSSGPELVRFVQDCHARRRQR